MEELKDVLIKHYGRIVLSHDLDRLIEKFDAVATAHIYAGNLGDNPLCKINRCLDEALTKLSGK